MPLDKGKTLVYTDTKLTNLESFLKQIESKTEIDAEISESNTSRSFILTIPGHAYGISKENNGEWFLQDHDTTIKGIKSIKKYLKNTYGELSHPVYIQEIGYTNDKKQESSKQHITDIMDQNISWRGQNLTNALLLAAEHGHKDVVEALLIGKGAKVNAKASNGGTALMIAAFNGHKDVVKVLIKNGARVNASNQNRVTALMYAAQYGHKDVVKALIGKSADVNATDSDGWTALMYAAQNGHKDVVEALLKRGADLGELDEGLLNALAAQADNLDFESLNALALHADNLGDEEFQKLKDTFINKYSDLALTNINVVKGLSNLASQIYIRRAKGNRRSQGNMCFPISLWNKTTKDAKMQDIKNATNLNDTLSKIVKKRSRFGFVISQASVDASEFVNNFIANNSQL